jgi:hypothetical protein
VVRVKARRRLTEYPRASVRVDLGWNKSFRYARPTRKLDSRDLHRILLHLAAEADIDVADMMRASRIVMFGRNAA